LATIDFFYYNGGFHFQRARTNGFITQNPAINCRVEGQAYQFHFTAGDVDCKLAITDHFFEPTSKYYDLTEVFDASASFFKVAGVPISVTYYLRYAYIPELFQWRIQVLANNPYDTATVADLDVLADYWNPVVP
jgi:hypothetical protein